MPDAFRELQASRGGNQPDCGCWKQSSGEEATHLLQAGYHGAPRHCGFIEKNAAPDAADWKAYFSQERKADYFPAFRSSLFDRTIRNIKQSGGQKYCPPDCLLRLRQKKRRSEILK